LFRLQRAILDPEIVPRARHDLTWLEFCIIDGPAITLEASKGKERLWLVSGFREFACPFSSRKVHQVRPNFHLQTEIYSEMNST
jgi:hypothetical protein